MSPSLRKAVAAAIGGGAVAIASVLITGPSGDDGLEGVSYIPYEDIVGVWTVCHGHTGKDIIPGKTYTEAECKALLNKDLATVARQINPYINVDIRTAGNGVSCLCQCGCRNDRTWPGQNAITGGAVADFDNLFDAAIARADETIRGYMGTSATITSGEQSGAVIRGVFDDPENISYAGQGVRVEGSSPSLFVRTDDVRQLRRGDTLTISEENFWVDRVTPDDGGSCHLWLGRGGPPAVNRRR